MVAIAFILWKHVHENFAWCVLDIIYTRLLCVDVHIYGQGSGFFPHPSSKWASSIAAHRNLRRHLLATRISSKIKSLIRMIWLFNFRVFRTQTSVLSKSSGGKEKKTAVYFPHYFLTCDQAFFLSERKKKEVSGVLFPLVSKTKRDGGSPDRWLTIFTILNNLKLVSFWMASRITNSTIFHIKRTLKAIIETFYFSWNRQSDLTIMSKQTRALLAFVMFISSEIITGSIIAGIVRYSSCLT